MTIPFPIPEEEAGTAPLASPTENEPVLLALPLRRGDSQAAEDGERDEPCLEQFQVIETGCGPPVETALLVELLTRSTGLGPGLADPAEVHHYHNPLAAVNAYKHRLHGLRCDYVNARLRIRDLETQLERLQLLEKHVRFLEDTLTEMRASRGWQLVEKCSRWRRTLSGWLAGKTKDESAGR